MLELLLEEHAASEVEIHSWKYIAATKNSEGAQRRLSETSQTLSKCPLEWSKTQGHRIELNTVHMQ